MEGFHQGSEPDLITLKHHSGCRVGDELKGESVRSSSPGKRVCCRGEGEGQAEGLGHVLEIEAEFLKE